MTSTNMDVQPGQPDIVCTNDMHLPDAEAGSNEYPYCESHLLKLAMCQWIGKNFGQQELCTAPKHYLERWVRELSARIGWGGRE